MNDGSGGSDARPNGGAAGSGGAASTSAGTNGEGGSAVAGASGAAASAGSSGGDEPDEQGCIPGQSCQHLCDTFGDDPACGLGNVSQCGCACEKRFNGPCPDELDALLACVGDTPSIDCSVRGRIFPGCEDESFALEVCDFQAREQLCAGSYPDCTPYCRAAMLSFCPQGPESVASCLCGCEASLVSLCQGEFSAFMSCSASAPTFSCDSEGRVTASACPSEWTALAGCMTAASGG